MENELTEIFANENGFCEFGPVCREIVNGWGRDLELVKRSVWVYYRPNAKKLNEIVLRNITCALT